MLNFKKSVNKLVVFTIPFFLLISTLSTNIINSSALAELEQNEVNKDLTNDFVLTENVYEVVLDPTDDLEVQNGQPLGNRGIKDTIVISSSTDLKTYKTTGRMMLLKFDLSGISGQIRKATLKIYQQWGARKPLRAAFVDDAEFAKECSESSTTFADMEQAGIEPSRLITLQEFSSPALNPPPPPRPMEIDVTLGAQIVQKIEEFEGNLVLCIYGWHDGSGVFNTTGTDIVSKEWDYTRTNGQPNDKLGGEDPSTHRPKLILQVSDTQNSDISSVTEDVYYLNEFMKGYHVITESIPLDALNLPNNSTVEWISSNDAYLKNDGTVVRPDFRVGDQTVLYTAKVTNGDYSQTVAYPIIIKATELTDEERVRLDLDYIKSKLHNMTAFENLNFPQTEDLEFGSTVVYHSNNPKYLRDDGTITRPGVNEKTVAVTLTVTVSYGTAVKTEDLIIYIPKEEEDMSHYIREDLENILNAAKKLIATPNHIEGKIVVEPEELTPESNIPSGPVVGDKWGQYPQAAFDKFQTLINEAEYILEHFRDDYTLCYSAAYNLIQGGAEFIRSANIDNTVLIKNQQDHKLVFSEYRRDLMAYVWEAETLLMLEDHLYPKSAKLALQKYIDEAKEALDYTYKFPFVRTRGFIVPRADEHIRQAIQRYAKRTTESDVSANEDGLKIQIEWYKRQHILMDVYETIKLVPTDDTYIVSTDPNRNYGNAENLQPGNGNNNEDPGGTPTHTAFIKFDLTPCRNLLILAAKFSIWQYWTPNTVKTNFYVLTDPGLMDWNEETFTYNEYLAKKTYDHFTDNRYITQLNIGGVNDKLNGRQYTFDVYDAIIQNLTENENRFTIIMYTPSKYEDPTVTDNRRKDYRSKEWGEREAQGYGPFPDQVPCIELKVNRVPVDRLRAKYERVMAEAQELLDKAKNNIGNDVGNYPQEYVDVLQTAMDRASDEMQIGDPKRVGIALVAVYDAMRDMRDNQVLRTNVDPESNLFFTAAEKLEIVEKIKSIPNLALFYEEQKVSADARKLSDFEERMILLDPAMSYSRFNELFRAFSKKSDNFTTPSNAKYASLEIVLPSENNTHDANAYNAELQKIAGGATPALRVGHIWIDNVRVDDPSGVSVLGDNNNLGFENIGADGKPLNWELTSNKGTPVYTLESRNNFVSEGSYSLRIENPTPDDEAVIKYYVNKENYVEISNKKYYLFEITPGITYTLNYDIKQDGFLVGFNSEIPGVFNKTGTQVILRFFDENKNLISTFTSYSNRKSGANYSFSQADGIAYLVTKDPVYAQKVKYGLLISANDFCQGAESWIVNNERPYGIDAYGEVQAGRFLTRALSTYALIEDANVFTEEEFEQFKRMIQYIVDFCINVHDQTIYDDALVQRTGNWETDMYAGAAIAAMALREPDPERPGQMKSAIDYGKQVIDNARWLLVEQMENNIAKSGAYSESIRYLWASYSRVTTLARALINTMNENWFETTKLPLLFEFVVQVQTPPYEYLDNRITVPNYGDCNIVEGPTGMVLLGQYYQDVVKVNPTLGMQMLETWKKAGMPIGVDREGALISAFFVPRDITNYLNIPLDLVSTDYYHQKSPIIMRNNQGRENETYICVISSTDAIGHGHADQGSFMLFSSGSYLVVDPGIESYFDAATKDQYLSSSNHSTLTFYKNNEAIIYKGNVSQDVDGKEVIDMTIAKNHINTGNTPHTSELKVSYYSDILDMVKIKIAPGAGGGEHYRNLAYIKNGVEAIVIWDQVKNNTSITQFNLPTAAKETVINENKIKTVGHYKMDLETTVLLPKDAEIIYDRIRAANIAPLLEGYAYPTIDVVRVIAKQPGQNHLTVLYPVEKGSEGLTTTEIVTGNPNVVAYRIQNSKGNWIIVVANDSDYSQNVLLEEDLIDMQTGNAYTGSVPANTMMILKPSSLADPIPTSVEIIGPTVIQKPDANIPLKYNYQAMLIDQYGNKMTGLNRELEIQPYILPSNLPPATGKPDKLEVDAVFMSPHPMTIGYPKIYWSIVPEVEGASIDENGILTIENIVDTNIINIVAESNGVKNNYKVQVVTDTIPGEDENDDIEPGEPTEAEGPDEFTTHTVSKGPGSGVINVRFENARINMIIDTEEEIVEAEISVRRYSEETERPLPTDKRAIGIFLQFLRSPNLEGIPIRIEVEYDSERLPDGVDESELKVYRYNDETKMWDIVANQGVDIEKKVIWAVLEHFGTFGVFVDMGEPGEESGDPEEPGEPEESEKPGVPEEPEKSEESEKSKDEDGLVQTGSWLDIKVLMMIGIVLLVVGIGLILWKRNSLNIEDKWRSI